MPSERAIAIEMYRDLERRYEEAGLPTNYLEVTVGVELFNTDRVEEEKWLKPDIHYVLSSLADAEQILVDHISGKPRKRYVPEFLARRLVNAIAQYIINQRTAQDKSSLGPSTVS